MNPKTKPYPGVNSCGFSLIELVIFIVVIGIVATSILMSFNTILHSTPRIKYQDNTLNYAITCTEWLLGQRYINGFDSLNTGTTVPNFCRNSLPDNYNIRVNISNISYNNDSSYKLITTTVTDTRGLGSAHMSVVVADY